MVVATVIPLAKLPSAARKSSFEIGIDVCRTEGVSLNATEKTVSRQQNRELHFCGRHNENVFFSTVSELSIFLDDCRRQVDAELEQLVPSVETEPVKLHSAIRWSLFGLGKRFRPAVVLAVGETFKTPQATLLRTAAAVEMIHTFSLIHDDLPSMDNDDLRRGRETCHVKYGDATAILAGDALQTLAFKVLAEDGGVPPKTRLKVISLIASASGTPDGMVAGQQLDLDAEGGNIENVSIETIHRRKTGALISASAVAAAMIAGASDHDLGAVERYADKIGLLFQITDDLLDVTQTSDTLGKTAGKDEASQKATYPARFGIEATRQMAAEICGEANAAISSISADTSLLASLADHILDRTA